MQSNPRHFDLNLLTALDALLATGSVTEAAERVHLSPPAMSHTLARIREAFGDPILVRAGRRLVPTARALALAEPVRQLLAQAQALRTPIDAQDLSTVRRHFVVRAPEGIAVVFGGRLSDAMAAAMPLASLQFLQETHQDPGGLRDGRIDLDLGRLSSVDPEVEAEVLAPSQQAMIGAVRTGHPLLSTHRGKPTLTPQRFAAARHVGINLRPGEHSIIDEALAAHGLQRHVALRVPSTFSALIAASRTDLVACAPERAVRSMAESLGLVVFNLPVQVPSQSLQMAWHPRHNTDPAHRWLRDCVRTLLDNAQWILPTVASTTKRPGRRAAQPRKT